MFPLMQPMGRVEASQASNNHLFDLLNSNVFLLEGYLMDLEPKFHESVDYAIFLSKFAGMPS